MFCSDRIFRNSSYGVEHVLCRKRNTTVLANGTVSTIIHAIICRMDYTVPSRSVTIYKTGHDQRKRTEKYFRPKQQCYCITSCSARE